MVMMKRRGYYFRIIRDGPHSQQILIKSTTVHNSVKMLMKLKMASQFFLAREVILVFLLTRQMRYYTTP